MANELMSELSAGCVSSRINWHEKNQEKQALVYKVFLISNSHIRFFFFFHEKVTS